MSSIAATGVSAAPRLTAEQLRGVLLWLMAFCGAFVFIEPSPYEVIGLLAILFSRSPACRYRAPQCRLFCCLPCSTSVMRSR